ncbi:hypothetical protein [Bdellovibrio svalbardensis]|uniref:Response regulatory domain-containing protein n=1 Tax=Bdellovibrio svalbardensis TaxID=2972972 RepID=A0ABT6DQQ2_9BACT|nr:hypothetical protein [Bdellovibrio svalbardensis]MDG0817488.1 hypothetical protein [Bdellovibrio svalbardensis]
MSEDVRKKSLLIIKANPAGLTSVENFLRNREWKIKSTSNLKEAMIFLVQEQPQFVMVSTNHPNKKVRNLPKILSQAFPVCVIAFAEESNALSLKNLSAAATEYLLYPPVTGPAVERTVNKYYKDQQAKPYSQQTNRMSLGKGDDNHTISIRGGEGGSQVIGGQGFSGGASAASVLAQLLGDDSQSSFTSGDGSSSNTNGYIPSHNQNSESANGSYLGGSNQPKNSHSTSGFSDNATDGDLAGVLRGTLDPNKSAVSDGASNSSGPFSAMSGSLNPNDPGMAGEGIGAGQKHAGVYDPDPYGDGKNHSTRSERKKSDVAWGPIETNKNSKKQRPGFESDSESANEQTDSIILRGTREALEQSCVRGSAIHEAPIEQSSNVACIVIESSRFSGYLIAAMGKNKIIDDSFIGNVREKLFKFLKTNGEQIQEQETMNINIKQVPFEDWALDYAEFLRKSIHQGNEVAMAFFPRADINAKFEESADQEMAALNIEDLAADVRVEFNLYVYLPRNGKYVLYTPKGGIFYGHQKDRLMKQNIKNLHLLKIDIQDLDKYRAQNYLNAKIDEFENKKRIEQMFSNPPDLATKKTA